MSGPVHVVVVGGGIAGLSAAHRLIQIGGPRVTLLEADDRLGGKIRTEPLAGRALDVGPEVLLTRQPAALALCRELGLADDLVAPRAERAFIWLDRLRPLPPRLLAGVPDGAATVIRSGILSPAGVVRAGLDLILPATPVREDVSIGQLVRSRLGNEVLERLIDPLLGGIHAGRCDELSVRATAPQLEAALRTNRSLVRGLRALAGGATPSGPLFMTLRGGLGELVDALRERLEPVQVSMSTTVAGIEPLAGGSLRVVLATGPPIEADHVILATPAFAAADVLDAACPAASRELRGIDYASVATVALAYAPGSVTLPPGASGLLVPPSQPRTITASTWSSAKWAHLGGGPVLIKCAVGRAGNRDALDLPDDELLARVRADLASAAGVRAEPLETRIVRFPQALPQYRVGHVARIARIDAALAALPGVQLAGAGYRGVGVAACIADGAAAAARVTEALDLSAQITHQAARPPVPGVQA